MLCARHSAVSGIVLGSENTVVSSKLDLVPASWSQSVPNMQRPHLNGQHLAFQWCVLWICPAAIFRKCTGHRTSWRSLLSEMGEVGSSLNRPSSGPAGPGLPDKSDLRGFRCCHAPCGDSGSCFWRTKPQIFSPTPELETPSAYLRVFIWTLRVCHVCVFG